MLGFERLTARNKNGLAYLVNVKPNEQEVDSPHKNTLKCILDCFERLAQYEDEAIARQSVKSEEVQRAIGDLLDMKEHWCADSTDNDAISIGLAITALQSYQPWVSVNDRLPTESELRNGMVLAWSAELCEWQVENWGYVEDRPDDYTHWKPLPEPPKGE